MNETSFPSLGDIDISLSQKMQSFYMFALTIVTNTVAFLVETGLKNGYKRLFSTFTPTP